MLKPRSLLNRIVFYGWLVILQHFISKRKKIYFQAINNKIYRDFYTMGFDKENFIRLPNGISTNKFKGIKRLHEGEVHFGFVGRLLKSKNLERLLRVFLNYISKYPEDKLFIYGSGPEEIFLQNFIHKNKVENNIVYMGFEKDKEKMYSNIDVLIHPSFGEGFPNVILEALCAQAFIIASNVIGNRDIIRHGITGLLFNPKDDEDLLNQLIFYKENPSRIPKMLQNAKIDVDKKYNIEKIADKLLNFLQKRINTELCEN
ncbi:MAG: glycosyltransferase family 4 protein [Promethearchaeota archaeon]